MIPTLPSVVPYEGPNSYIFISYAHADAQQVLPVISSLNEHGYRVWYDDGIEVGSEWQECIAQHLQNAEAVICFISDAYVRSDNCRKELYYSLSKKKNIVNVFLENAALTPGVELQISSIFSLMRHDMEDDTFYSKLYTSPALSNPALQLQAGEVLPAPRSVGGKPRIVTTPKKKSPIGKILAITIPCVLVGCLIAALIVGYFTGFLQRTLESPVVLTEIPEETEAVFASEAIADAAREYSGKEHPTVKDLRGLTDLDLSGKAVDSLEGLQYFPDLYSLNLSSCSLTSLRTLPPCTVVSLDLSGNTLASLDGIENAPYLKILKAQNCKTADLGNLNLCQELETADLLNDRVDSYRCFTALNHIRTIVFSNTTLKGISQVLDQSSLRYVTITDSDLTGNFFHAFDNENDLISLTLINCKLDSLRGIDDFSSLQELTLENCTGLSDLTELDSLDPRTTVTIR